MYAQIAQAVLSEKVKRLCVYVNLRNIFQKTFPSPKNHGSAINVMQRFSNYSCK